MLEAGLSPTTVHHIAAVLKNTGRLDVIYWDGTTQAFSSDGLVVSVSAATDYELRLVVSGTTAKVYVDGTLKITTTFSSPEVGVGLRTDQAGIYQYDSTPASNTARQPATNPPRASSTSPHISPTTAAMMTMASINNSKLRRPV